MSTNQEPQVFIDGKTQIIEMLRVMPREEKSKLIRNLRSKNPSLADELLEKGLSFDELGHLNREKIHSLFRYIPPAVLGLALWGTEKNFQRRILSTMERPFAEEAYGAMVSPGATEEKALRARKRVLRLISQLF